MLSTTSYYALFITTEKVYMLTEEKGKLTFILQHDARRKFKRENIFVGLLVRYRNRCYLTGLPAERFGI